ncbi:restriction endonuclease, partial [Pseudomonas sp. SIMBA_065]
MAHHKATAVAIVCTGKFTRDAATFATGKPIELVTGEALAELVLSVQRGAVSPARVRPVAAGSRRA